MLKHYPAQDRGHVRHGWLDTWHSFSFASFYDPARMGFRSLRVINDDTIAPGQGFGMHPHEDMEILTWVLSGELAHQDSTGKRAILRHGDIQRMSAGTGVVHSERNPSTTTPVHLLQIWIEPDRSGVAPRYDDRTIPAAARTDRLALVAAPEATEHGLAIHQDARVYAGSLSAGTRWSHRLAAGRGAWIHVATGAMRVAGAELRAGDAAIIEEPTEIALEGLAGGGEALLFDLR